MEGAGTRWPVSSPSSRVPSCPNVSSSQCIETYSPTASVNTRSPAHQRGAEVPIANSWGEVRSSEEVSSGDDELDKYIVAVLQTPSSVPLVFPEEEDDELKAMSQSLDALGWKKIIVDLRSEIPIGVSVPTVVRKSSLRKKFTLSSSPPIVASTHLGESKEYVSSLQDVDTDEEIENGAMADSTAFVETLKRRSVIESRDVKEAFSAPRDATIRWPVGHNMICAFSRGRVSSHMNRGGRSVMDRLARDLAEDMHGWEPPSDK